MSSRFARDFLMAFLGGLFWVTAGYIWAIWDRPECFLQPTIEGTHNAD